MTLGWNQRDYTKRFIDSVREHWQGLEYELLLLDNGSVDGTTTALHSKVDKLLRLSKNIGFGQGFNELRKVASGDYLCMVNNDAEFMSPPVLRESPDLVFWTACNVRSMLNNRKRRVLQPSFRRIGKYSQILPSGVAMIMPTRLFDKVGGFSKEFGLASGEDSDLCFKVWKAGQQVWVDEHVWLNHEGKASAKQLDNWQGLWRTNSIKLKKKWQRYF